ncbi:LSU ribosomal protein L27p [[Mycoplasma] cavipharyngis]|uniref:50S ribosomal protein L27 n=1 Tax=[Mycoplasma] cavipharyngis TaxID=92757 RepID=UPI0037044FF1
MSKIIYHLQFFASKKGVGSTKNGRDSNPKFLGAKLADGQTAKTGQIIYRQRGNRIFPGKGVGQGGDDTLFALKDGIVKYRPYLKRKTKVEIVPVVTTKNN